MFDALYLQTMHIASSQGVDEYGQYAYGAPTPRACRYEPSTRLLRDKDGAQVVSEAVLFTAQDVGDDDLVFAPGVNPSDISNGRKPLRIERHFGLMSGQLSHVVVHI